jgi:hypothetical protein
MLGLAMMVNTGLRDKLDERGETEVLRTGPSHFRWQVSNLQSSCRSDYRIIRAVCLLPGHQTLRSSALRVVGLRAAADHSELATMPATITYVSLVSV